MRFEALEYSDYGFYYCECDVPVACYHCSEDFGSKKDLHACDGLFWNCYFGEFAVYFYVLRSEVLTLGIDSALHLSLLGDRWWA